MALSSNPLADRALLKQVERIRLGAPRAVGASAGSVVMRAKGGSHELFDFRDYAPGDDLRYLDWNAYARLDKMYMREFHDERAPSVAFLLDDSSSMSFGTVPKREAAAALCAALARSFLMQSCMVRLAGLGTTGQLVDTRCRDLTDMVRRLRAGAPTASDVPETLRRLARASRRPSGAVVLTDCFYDGLGAAVRSAAAAGMGIWVLHVVSEHETAPEWSDELLLVDSEAGAEVNVSAPEGAAQAYAAAWSKWTEETAIACTAPGVAHGIIESGQSLAKQVLRAARAVPWLTVR